MVGRVRDVRPADSRTGADALFLSENGNFREMETDSGCCLKCKTSCGIFAKYVLVRGLFFSLYVLDIATDVNAAYRDYIAGDLIFACITMGLVFIPGCLFALYTACQSCLMYAGELTCLKSVGWILIAPLLPLWPLLRGGYLILLGLICALIPSKRSKIIPVLDKPSREHLVRFLEGFLEAAPQLLVRLYRVATRNPQQFSDLTGSEIAQITMSLLTLSLKIVSTHKKSVTTTSVVDGELEHEGKFQLSWYVQLSAFIWWVCFLLSRFEALALFTASYGLWTLLVVGLHVLLLFSLQVAADVEDTFRRIIIYFFGAFVFVFSYIEFNLKSRVKTAIWLPYTLFAVIIFIEDTIMLMLWFFYQRSTLLRDFPQLNSTITKTNITLDQFSAANTTEIAPFQEDSGFVDDGSSLQKHWEILLFIHYGVFALGLVFMIITFVTGGVRERSEMEKEHREHGEMVNVTRIEEHVD